MKLIIGNKKYSTWSLRAWLALKQAGLDFEEIKLNLDTPEFEREIEKFSPTRQVPVLHHDGLIITESLAIIDYIDRLCPDAKIWPKDLKAFGYAKAISAEMHSGFKGLRSYVHMNLGKKFRGMELGPEVAKNVARIDEIWTSTRETFGGTGDFLFGEFSGADMMFAPVVHRFNGYDLPRSDVSDKYIQAMLNHPLMQEWTKEGEKETEIVEADEVDPNIKRLG